MTDFVYWDKYIKGSAHLKEHLRSGAHCPNCGGTDIQGDAIEIEGNEAHQDCACATCGLAWRDFYKLYSCEPLADPHDD